MSQEMLHIVSHTARASDFSLQNTHALFNVKLTSQLGIE